MARAEEDGQARGEEVRGLAGEQFGAARAEPDDVQRHR
jgi:hypothetical protein